MFQSKYPKPAVTVDCVIFGYIQGTLKVLLIKRGLEPFKGSWALPGGFVKLDETLDEAAKRELEEETGLSCTFMEQLYTFGAVHRDPRERVISVAYYALIDLSKATALNATTDADDAQWFDIKDIPTLAFDHAQVLATALERLKGKIAYQPIVFELLPSKFIFSDLERIYETLLQQPLNRRNFRTKMLATGVVEELDEYLTGTSFRPPKLFRFNKKKYEKSNTHELNLRF